MSDDSVGIRNARKAFQSTLVILGLVSRMALMFDGQGPMFRLHAYAAPAAPEAAARQERRATAS